MSFLKIWNRENNIDLRQELTAIEDQVAAYSAYPEVVEYGIELKFEEVETGKFKLDLPGNFFYLVEKSDEKGKISYTQVLKANHSLCYLVSYEPETFHVFPRQLSNDLIRYLNNFISHAEEYKHSQCSL